ARGSRRVRDGSGGGLGKGAGNSARRGRLPGCAAPISCPSVASASTPAADSVPAQDSDNLLVRHRHGAGGVESCEPLVPGLARRPLHCLGTDGLGLFRGHGCSSSIPVISDLEPVLYFIVDFIDGGDRGTVCDSV